MEDKLRKTELELEGVRRQYQDTRIEVCIDFKDFCINQY